MATATEPDIDGGLMSSKSPGGPLSLETTYTDIGGYHGYKTPGGAVPKERERKIGHRRVDEKTGTVTYKKKSTSELQAAIQLGIGQSVGGLSSKPERDLLMQDFGVVQSVFFPSEGSNITPAHHYSDFKFKTYATLAFRYFRELFNIRPDDFMLSLCDEPMTELSNPGAGGSIFYISADDEFIIKTAQHKEASFLQKLLPGYYMNLNQNPRTLLPKFYGLYCYQCGGKNIRFVVMNNILPSVIQMHEKYDLKGSTYKRKASKSERAKKSPTLKDLDFMELHPEGLLLEKDTYDRLIKTVQRDCRVLESFKIMDYSLLVGIHNLDQAKREKNASDRGSMEWQVPSSGGLGSSQGTNNSEVFETRATVDRRRGTFPVLEVWVVRRNASDRGSTDGQVPSSGGLGSSQGTNNSEVFEGKTPRGGALARGKSIRTKVTQYSTPMESIQADSPHVLDEFDDEDIPPGGIPAKNGKGDRLLLYLGIIDILQCYRMRKKLEHSLKAMITDGDTVSVTRPSFYADRFQKFFTNTVFKKAPSPLKHSPSKRKPGGRTTSMNEDQTPGIMGARPDLLMGSATPPPPFSEAIAAGARPRDRTSVSPLSSRRGPDATIPRSERLFQTIQQQQDESYRGRMRHSPLSMSESTPTYTEFTEGTPSYTASSPSCSSEVLDSHIPSLPLESESSSRGVSRESLNDASPSRVMVTSSSTDASYYSTVSHIDPPPTTGSQPDRQTDRQSSTDRQVDRQTSNNSNKQTISKVIVHVGSDNNISMDDSVTSRDTTLDTSRDSRVTSRDTTMISETHETSSQVVITTRKVTELSVKSPVTSVTKVTDTITESSPQPTRVSVTSVGSTSETDTSFSTQTGSERDFTMSLVSQSTFASSESGVTDLSYSKGDNADGPTSDKHADGHTSDKHKSKIETEASDLVEQSVG